MKAIGGKQIKPVKKQKYKVFLQPFSDTITDRHWVEFPCTNCSEKVKATAKVQKEMCVGELGHECKHCNTYFALINCPNCKKITGFDDNEWDLLSRTDEISCPSCKISLFREEALNNIKLSSNDVSLNPTLSNWSLSESETIYLSNIRSECDIPTQNKIATYHHSVGMRVKSAKNSFEYIVNNQWYSPLLMSNTPDLITEESNKTPFDYEFQSNLFSFVNNLRSALDILSQEIAIVGKVKTEEHYVEFQKQNTYLNDNIYINKLVEEYIKSDMFIYLNKLRNVLQHRRIPMLVTRGEFNLKILDTIKPMSVSSQAHIKLPDNPSKKESEYTFNKNIEYISFIKEAMNMTNKFIIDVYSKLI